MLTKEKGVKEVHQKVHQKFFLEKVIVLDEPLESDGKYI